eukprot:m.11878 g.11878  ORF g.11878 m.11878 type:complete len:220 (-) comp7868_c0_seq2:51-710(-)
MLLFCLPVSALALIVVMSCQTLSIPPPCLPDLRTMAKIILKSINQKLELTPPLDFFAAHPQQQDTAGLEHMQHIAAYKKFHGTFTLLKHKGQKPAKFLGRTFLKWVWPEFVLALDTFSSELAQVEETMTSTFVSSVFDDESPFWIPNFQQHLHQRALDRKETTTEVGQQYNADGVNVNGTSSAMSQEELLLLEQHRVEQSQRKPAVEEEEEEDEANKVD